MSILVMLIFGTAVTAIASAVCSLKVASIKNERHEVVEMLEQSIGAKPDNMTGDTMALSLVNQEDARIAAKNVADSAPWSRAAAGLSILSAVLSLAAGLAAV